MRRIGRFFGKRQNRKQGKLQGRLAKHGAQFTPHLEALEERRLLAANTLGFALADVVDGTRMELNVTGGSDTTVLALRIAAENGSPLDPATPWIERLDGVSIAPIYSTHDVVGSTDSLFLAELGPGTYSITIKTEDGTAGLCRADALLPGDIDGNGFVSDHEYMQASAAAVQDSGSWNSFTARYYSSMGFDLNVDQYHPALDVDADGHIDSFDLGNIHPNACVSLEVVATVTANDEPEFTPPAPAAQTAEDSAGIDIDLWDYVEDRETVDADLTFADVSSPHGTATLDADGHTVHFAPAENYNGTAEVTFSVTDIGENGAAPNTVIFTGNIVVAPVNDSPVAEAAGIIATDEDNAVDIDLRTRVEDVETADDDLTFIVKNPTGGTVVLLGDGHTARFTPTANYNGPATFDFDVTDTGDGTAAAVTAGFSTAIDVAPINDTPAAEDTLPVNVDEDADVTVDLRTRVGDIETADADLVFNLEDPATHDPPATTVTAIEGSGTLELLPNAGGNDFEVRFTPDTDFNGLVLFSIWVTDTGDGTSAPITMSILLAFAVDSVNDAPVAADDTAGTDADQTVAIDVLANDTDIDTANDPPDVLSIDSLNTPPGFEGTVAIVDGKVVFDPTGSAAIKALEDGETLVQTFDYTVKDSGDPALTDTATVTITITGVNDAPELIVLPPVEVAEDNTVDFDLDNYFTDVETADADCTVVIDGVTNGTYTYDTLTHVVSFTPNANYNGPATVTFSVTDTANDPGNAHTVQMIAHITVTPVNDPPVAEATDTIDTDEDTAVDIDLRTRVDDVETVDDDLDFTVKNPVNGTVVLLADGYTARFTPAANYNGTGAAFDFDVTDTGDNGAAAETVEFTVDIDVAPVNDAPAAESTDTVYVEEDGVVDIDLWDYVSDVETLDADLVLAVKDPAHGTVELLADGHTARFTPTADYQGPASFKFDATDTGDNGAAAKTTEFEISIIVTPVNDPPVLDDATPVDTDEDTAVDLDLRTRVSDTETDDDDLTFAVKNPTHGTVVLLADGYTARFTPDANYNGTASFEFDVTDTGEGTAPPKTETFSLDVEVAPINDAPFADPAAPAIAGTEDTDLDINLREQFDDLETGSDGLAFVIVSATGGSATLDVDGYTVHFTPDADYAGAASVTVDVTDTGDGPSAAITERFALNFNIENTPDAPVAADDTAGTDADQTVAIDVLANDTDVDPGDTLSIVEPLTPPGGFEGTISVVDGKIVFDPAGSAAIEALEDGQTLIQTFDYTVEDSDGLIDTATVTITVTGINDAPEQIVLPPVEVAEDGSVDIDLDAYFTDVETASADCEVVIDGVTNGTYTYDTLTHVVSFTPDANYNGPATVTFSVTDTANDPGNKNTVQMTADVTVTPVNDIPTAEDTGTIATDEDTAVDIDLRTRVDDVETVDDDLDFTVKNPAHGTVVLLADGYTARFTPDANYNGPATFEFDVTDTGDNGAAAETVGFMVNIDVAPVNDAPFADPAAPAIAGTEDTALDINLREQFDDLETGSDGLAFVIVNATGGSATLDVDGYTVHFTPDADYAGAASVTVDVTDTGDGPSAAITERFTLDFNIDNTPDAPVAADDTAGTDADQAVAIDVLANDTDVDPGDTLSIVEPLTPPGGFEGTISVVGGKIVFDPAGSAAIEALEDGQTLEQTFDYTVEDSDGLTDTATVTITVTGINDAPEQVVLPPVEVAEDGSVDIDLDAYFTDVETASADCEVVIDGVTNGTYTYDTLTHVVSFTPDANYNGPATVTFSVTDTANDPGNKNTVQMTADITVTPVNDAPVANDDPETGTTTVPDDDDTALDVLANDTDIDVGDTLTILSVDTAGIDGSVAIAGDNLSLIYTPSGSYLGPETFTYTVSDGNGGESTATVRLTVIGNHDPVADDDTYGVSEDAVLNENVLANDSDVDPGDTLTVTGVTNVTGNLVNFSPTVAADGSFSYDPRADHQFLAVGETRQGTFDYTISDGNGGTATATVTVTVTGVNDDPTAAPDSGATAADTATGGSLAGLVDDVDTSDTMAYGPASDTSTLSAAVTIDPASGAWTYDPSGVAAFIALADGETLIDTFTYTVDDGNGGTAQNTITITVTGVNDAPTAVDDSGNTSNTGTVDIALLTNDTDPDTTDTLFVASFDITGTNGTVTNNGDGTVTYDPSGWTEAQNLAPGATLQDTFAYTVSDGNGGTDTATVTVTVTGTSGSEPTLDNPIDDRTIFDDEPQPITYDLSTVFSDDGALVYTATSSNENLVQVSIVGSTLSLTYAAYQSGMDRTPAIIDVTATEAGGAHNSVADQFVVTVTPETTIDVQFVVLTTPTPAGQLDVPTLPDSITSISVGQSYIVEIWMTDMLDSSLTSGPISTGITGGSFDIGFDKALGQVSSATHDGPFDTIVYDDIRNDLGIVDDFTGSTTTPGSGFDGNYARLGYITIQANASGDQVFSLSYEDFARMSTESGGGQVVTGKVDAAQVDLPTVTISQQEFTQFSVIGTSAVTIGGVCYGQDLVAQLPGSDVSWLTGSIDAVLQYDAGDEVSSIQFVGAAVSATNLVGDDLAPGVGGTAGTAPANVGLKDAAGIFNLALRDMVLDVLSGLAIPVVGTQIDQSGIDYSLSGGSLDLRYGPAGSSSSLSGRPLYESSIIPGFNTPMGVITKIGNTIDITLPIKQFVDISDITGTPDDYLTFNVSLHGTYDIPAMTATETSQTDASDQTDIVMTLSKSATALDAGGQVATLPMSEAWIDEWDSYWVEIWARTGEGSGINAAGLDLAYNGDYFTAVELQHGRAFTQNTSGDISTDGIVSGFGGQAAAAGLGTGGFVLVGRVQFESLGDDQVPINSADCLIGPHDLGLEISNVQIDVEGVDEPQIVHAAAPATELWAVPYDVDDNGQIDLGDLSFFAQAYDSDVLQSDTPFVWASDYDKSGDIDLGDLAFFSTNFRCSRAGDSDISYPASFLQRWIGAGIDAEGDSAVHEVLEAAVETWREKLGLDQPIDIQLVVKDFGTSQLGEGQILEVDEEGRPIRGRITLDDNAAGMGWYSQLDSAPAESKYDLYTVILHEVGHTLGFMRQYDGFADNVQPDGLGGLIFVGDDFTAHLDAAGQHLDAAAHPGAVMNSMLSPGVRRLPSDLAVEMLKMAYDSAIVVGGGFGGGAAMHAGVPARPVALAATTCSTADFSPTGDRLDGDVTWDRMFGDNNGRLDPPHAQSVDRAILDTVVDDISRGDFDGGITEASEITRFDAADIALHTHGDDQVAAGLFDKKADDKNIFDAVFGDWQEPLG